MGEKLLPFRAMAIPIRLTDASTNISRYELDASYMALYNHCATERQLLFCISVKNTPRLSGRSDCRALSSDLDHFRHQF